MARKLLLPLMAVIIIAAMVIPGCGEPGATYALTIDVSPSGAGTATFTGTSPFAANAKIPIEATANTGWRFSHWTTTAGYFTDPFTDNPNEFNMPASAATVTANFVVQRTQGFWLDRIIIEQDADEARSIERLADGEFDVFAHTLDNQVLFDIVQDDANLWYKESIGSFNTFRINPYGPVFDTTDMVNPFHYQEMQEALHKYIDREYIGNIIMGGLGLPRFTSFHPLLADYARYYDATNVVLESSVGYLETLYEYDETAGALLVEAAMAMIHADVGLISGDIATGWLYDGAPITMTVGVRQDDPVRDQIGDYLVLQLEKMGFQATAFKGDMTAVLYNLVNIPQEIVEGGWSFYTGGWVSTVLSRDEGYWFTYFHTDYWGGIPSNAYLDVPVEFYDAAWDLMVMNFTSFAERDSFVEVCLPVHMEVGMFYLTCSQGFSALSTTVDLGADKAGGIYGSWLWALTAHFRDPVTFVPEFGGDLRVNLVDMLTAPWNPVDGSNSVYDMFPIRATGDMGTHPDIRDGLRWAGRIESAVVTVSDELPIRTGTPDVRDWVTLIQTPTPIETPDDAWRGWDPVLQQPITVLDAKAAPAEPWGLNVTEDEHIAACYAVSYYPADIFDHPLHDGSTLSFADFLYYWILAYDRGQADSEIFDKAAETELPGQYDQVIGTRFSLPDGDAWGLKVEVWSSLWEMDAERMVTTMFPNYDQGNGFWHPLALAILAERNYELAFGQAKSQGYPLDDPVVPASIWTGFIAGESLSTLDDYLQVVLTLAVEDYEDATIPYYDFIVAEYSGFEAEVAARMANLNWWVNLRDNPYEPVDGMGHFWIGAGPYYLANVGLVPPFVILEAFEDYPDARDRWFFLLEDLDY